MACGATDLAIPIVNFLNPLVDVGIGGVICSTKAESVKNLCPHTYLSLNLYFFSFDHIKQINININHHRTWISRVTFEQHHILTIQYFLILQFSFSRIVRNK